MPDKMYLVVTIRKEVADAVEGKALYEIVKQKLSDHPDVQLAGLVTNHFLPEEIIP